MHLSKPFLCKGRGRNPEEQMCLLTLIKTGVKKAHQVMSLLVVCRNLVFTF